MFVMLILTLSLLFLHTSECYKTYVTPNKTWIEAFTYCRQRYSGRLATTSAVEWKIRGTPPDLPLNTWVWVGALFLESHTWNPSGGNKTDLLEYVGCYEVPDILQATQYKNVEGPPECHRKCGRQHPGGHMYLKGSECYCLPSSQPPDTRFRVESQKCDVICQKSFHWCGGNEYLYSVYTLSRSLRVDDDASWEGPCFQGKFNTSDKEMWTLQITNSSCNDTKTAVCVFHNKTVSLFAERSFSEALKSCQKMNSSLPLTFDSVSSKSVDFRSYRNNVTGGHSVLDKSFWLNLKRSESPYWIDDRPFTEPNISRTTARCVAMRVTIDGSVTFYATPCTTSLPALCSGNEHNKREGSGLAIIAGAVGAGVLVVFCLLAVLLVCLRRHGKLRSSRARSTDSYKSSSRNSDVTSSEQPGPARGQRSDTSVEVTDELGHMLATEPPTSRYDTQYTYVNHSLQHSYANHKDLGRSETGHVISMGGHDECAEMYSLTYSCVDTVGIGTRDSEHHLQQPTAATYTNVDSLPLASSGGIGPQDPDVPLQGDTAESLKSNISFTFSSLIQTFRLGHYKGARAGAVVTTNMSR